MSHLIGIMGESGAGKTTSLKTLDPKETFIIDADKKGLTWKNWRQDYNGENKNYYRTDNQKEILKFMKAVNERRPEIHNLILDTVNGVMVADEMRRSKEKGYDKWADLAECVYTIIDSALTFRDDLFVIFVCHAQIERDDKGNVWSRIKTSGKKLDKIVLESKFNTVLFAKCVDGKHIFETHANNSTAKTPLGAFEEDNIPNNLADVLEVLKDYV